MHRMSACSTNRGRSVLLCAACCGLGVALLFAGPEFGATSELMAAPPGVVEYDELTPAQTSAIRSLEVLTTLWFFIVGSCVGSFLNVVVYRLPLGMSLTKPKSRCPVCETPIRRWDNLPVIGWLRLRGRCRTCKSAISPRYPLVEAGVGLIFLSLLHFELLSGGTNLPWRDPNHYAGVLWIIWYAKWDLIGIYVYHCGLLCVLTAAALIEVDGQRIPIRPLVGCLLGFLILPVLWPTLHPVPLWTPPWEWLNQWEWRWTVQDTIFTPGWNLSVGLSLSGLLDGLAGFCVGAFICSLTILASPAQKLSDRSSLGLLGLYGLVGIVLGWQQTVSAVLFSSILRFLFVRVLRRPIWMAFLTAGTSIQILFGRTLAEFSYWPCYQSHWAVHVGAIVVILALSRLHADSLEIEGQKSEEELAIS